MSKSKQEEILEKEKVELGSLGFLCATLGTAICDGSLRKVLSEMDGIILCQVSTGNYFGLLEVDCSGVAQKEELMQKFNEENFTRSVVCGLPMSFHDQTASVKEEGFNFTAKVSGWKPSVQFLQGHHQFIQVIDEEDGDDQRKKYPITNLKISDN